MKIAILCLGLLLGYAAFSIVDLREDYSQSVELAEAHCAIFAVSASDIELDPSNIGCRLVVDDDWLLTFEVIGGHRQYVDCLPGTALFGRKFPLRECSLYQR